MNADELNQTGLNFYNQGQWQTAFGYFEQALELSRTTGDRAAEATALDRLAGLYCYRLGQRRQALEYYQQALEIWRQIGDKTGEAITGVNIAGMYQADGLFEEARELMEHVIELDVQTNSPELRSHRIILGAIRKRLRRLAEESNTSEKL